MLHRYSNCSSGWWIQFQPWSQTGRHVSREIYTSVTCVITSFWSVLVWKDSVLIWILPFPFYHNSRAKQEIFSSERNWVEDDSPRNLILAVVMLSLHVAVCIHVREVVPWCSNRLSTVKGACTCTCTHMSWLDYGLEWFTWIVPERLAVMINGFTLSSLQVTEMGELTEIL